MNAIHARSQLRYRPTYGTADLKVGNYGRADLTVGDYVTAETLNCSS